MAVDILTTGRRPCGRPTRSGDPCRNEVGPYEVGCKVHTTSDEREWARIAWAAFWRGHEEGRESERDDVMRSAEFEARQAARRAEEAAMWRERDARGRQLVQVAGSYTYVWTGTHDLQVGDVVTVPGCWIPGMEAPHDEPVIALGSTYRGDIKAIIALVRSAATV